MTSYLVLPSEDFSSIVAALASLVVLYLVYKKYTSKTGFCTASSCNDLGVSRYNMAGIRDDTGSVDLHAKSGFANPNRGFKPRVLGGFANPNRGFKPRVLGGFSGEMEPPVFWNPGSYAQVGNAQQDGIAAEGTGDDGTAWSS